MIKKEQVQVEIEMSDRLGQMPQDLFDGEVSSILASSLGFLPSLDHFIRSIQQRLRNDETDLLRRFQIDHQIKLRGLLDRQIGGLGSLENLVHVDSYAPVAVREVRPIGHEATGICI